MNRPASVKIEEDKILYRLERLESVGEARSSDINVMYEEP